MNTHLVLTDFDGTLADTSKLSPSEENVSSAYEAAVLSVFGDKGLAAYHDQGGLKNREPGELARALQVETGMFDSTWQDLTERLVAAKLDCLLPEIGPGPLQSARRVCVHPGPAPVPLPGGWPPSHKFPTVC